MSQEAMGVRDRLREIRDRVRSRLREIRQRIGLQEEPAVVPRARSQIVIGKGALINRARTKVDELVNKALELRPGILDILRTAKPGQRVARVVEEITRAPTPAEKEKKPGDVITEETGKPKTRRNVQV